MLSLAAFPEAPWDAASHSNLVPSGLSPPASWAAFSLPLQLLRITAWKSQGPLFCLPPNVSLLWVFSTHIFLHCSYLHLSVSPGEVLSHPHLEYQPQLIPRANADHQDYLPGPQPAPGTFSLGSDGAGVVPGAIREATADSALLSACPEGISQKKGGGDQAAALSSWWPPPGSSQDWQEHRGQHPQPYGWRGSVSHQASLHTKPAALLTDVCIICSHRLPGLGTARCPQAAANDLCCPMHWWGVGIYRAGLWGMGRKSRQVEEKSVWHPAHPDTEMTPWPTKLESLGSLLSIFLGKSLLSVFTLFADAKSHVS